MNKPVFANRFEAGQAPARHLEPLAGRPDLLVLALPRGGVPVAFPIAHTLRAPLDVFIVRKLGVPGHEELAMGAIASGGVRVLNQEVVQHLGVPEQVIEAVAREELLELERREQLFRGSRLPPVIAAHHVVLVDDGLATGASMRAGIKALRRHGPKSITVAVPVAAPETCDQFRHEVDKIICGMTPEPFLAVGYWYKDFAQTSDTEVRELLERATQERQARAFGLEPEQVRGL